MIAPRRTAPRTLRRTKVHRDLTGGPYARPLRKYHGRSLAAIVTKPAAAASGRPKFLH